MMKEKKQKKAHGIKLLIRAVVTDPDGKILSDTGQKPSKSFVIQFLQFIRGMFDGVTTVAKNTAGVTADQDIYYTGYAIRLSASNGVFMLDAPINISTYGIVVGTGDTAVDNEDYKLETQLTEGAGAGNITHGAMDIEPTAVVGANVDLETKRSFPNNTGSTITVKEAGAYIKQGVTKVISHCIIRDVLGAPIDVPDKCALTIYYTFRTTV